MKHIVHNWGSNILSIHDGIGPQFVIPTKKNEIFHEKIICSEQPKMQNGWDKTQIFPKIRFEGSPKATKQQQNAMLNFVLEFTFQPLPLPEFCMLQSQFNASAQFEGSMIPQMPYTDRS